MNSAREPDFELSRTALSRTVVPGSPEPGSTPNHSRTGHPEPVPNPNLPEPEPRLTPNPGSPRTPAHPEPRFTPNRPRTRTPPNPNLSRTSNSRDFPNPRHGSPQPAPALPPSPAGSALYRSDPCPFVPNRLEHARSSETWKVPSGFLDVGVAQVSMHKTRAQAAAIRLVSESLLVQP